MTGVAATAPDVGLFGPASASWRVLRENVLLAGGGRALILQVAHPLVGAGVMEHSRYRSDPWGRLYRTLDLTTRVVFASRAGAEEAARRIARRHARVRGVTPWSAGRFPRGTPYDAREPELLLWVHATLVDTALLVYRSYVGELERPEQERYYQEQRRFAELLGVPLERQPDTLEDFERYVADTLASDAIAVSPALRDVADAVLRPPLPFVARPLVEALNLATVGMLPPRLRRELGLGWGEGRARLLAGSRLLVRQAMPLLPGLLRELPPARLAERRVAR